MPVLQKFIRQVRSYEPSAPRDYNMHQAFSCPANFFFFVIPFRPLTPGWREGSRTNGTSELLSGTADRRRSLLHEVPELKSSRGAADVERREHGRVGRDANNRCLFAGERRCGASPIGGRRLSRHPDRPELQRRPAEAAGAGWSYTLRRG
jgi:hypothetical protein